MPEVMRNAAASVLGGHLSSSTAQCCVLPAGGWRKPSGDGALRGEPAPHQCYQPCKGQKSVSNHRGLSAKRLETSQSEVDVLGCPRSPLGLHASWASWIRPWEGEARQLQGWDMSVLAFSQLSSNTPNLCSRAGVPAMLSSASATLPLPAKPPLISPPLSAITAMQICASLAKDTINSPNLFMASHCAIWTLHGQGKACAFHTCFISSLFS